MRPHSGSVLYMEGPALNCPYRRPHSDYQDTIKMQPQTAYIITAQYMIISLFANVSSLKVVDPFPYQETIK